jgi:pimeloyl-ACP methyl ester carboxylesterase
MRLAFAIVLTFLAAASAKAQSEDEGFRRPVHSVAPNTIEVVAPDGGKASFGFFASRALGKPDATVTRAVIIVHGRLRNAGTYFESGLQAMQAAAGAQDDTIVIAPQFLASVDAEAHGTPANVLRWSLEGWQGGEAAVAPAPVSSYAALDALVAYVADKTRHPNLKTVVIAGHSGGGQVVQRYAILSQVGDNLEKTGVHVRYVVANPSSYAYFTGERLTGDGRAAAFDASTCPAYNDWRYGMNRLPLYAGGRDATALERAYIARDVVYLLGDRDTNPNHNALDKTCMAEAQGPHRLARGLAYVADLKRRHGAALRHRLFQVPGVGHSGDRMLTSPCGLFAMFDREGCAAS